jgi:hypothetical protein
VITPPGEPEHQHNQLVDDLPRPILFNILTILAKCGGLRTLAALAETSKQIHHLVIPFLYKEIHISSIGAWHGLLRAIETPTTKASLAGVVDSKHKWRRNKSPNTVPGARLLGYFEWTEYVVINVILPSYSFIILRSALSRRHPSTDLKARLNAAAHQRDSNSTVELLFPNAKVVNAKGVKLA